MNASADREPLAHGSLDDTPLCHAALYVFRRNQTGTLLVITPNAGEATIRFLRGRATAAIVPWPAKRLLDGLLPLCGLREGQFGFYADDIINEGDPIVSGVVDPHELLIASLDEHSRDDMVEQVLQRFAGSSLRLAPGCELERLRLRPEHKPLIDLIRAAPAGVDELVAQAPLPPIQTRRLLYALLASHMVTNHEGREGEASRSQVEPSVRRASSPGVATPSAWQQLASLRPSANGSARPPAAAAPATSLRPPGNSLRSSPRSSLQPSSAAASDRPSAASSIRPVSIAPGDDKASRLKRADQLLQRGRPDEALAEAEALLREDPNDVELMALRAQALFEKHQVNPEGIPKTVLDAIKKALDADPEQPRALYIKGLVFKRGGELKKAVVYFRRVLQAEPKHLEAQREIRLAKLRTSSDKE